MRLGGAGRGDQRLPAQPAPVRARLAGRRGDRHRRAGPPAPRALAQATGETIHLATLDRAEIVYLDKFDSPLPVAAYSRVGGRAPAYCVASGKALLAAAAARRSGAARAARHAGRPHAEQPHRLRRAAGRTRAHAATRLCREPRGMAARRLRPRRAAVQCARRSGRRRRHEHPGDPLRAPAGARVFAAAAGRPARAMPAPRWATAPKPSATDPH